MEKSNETLPAQKSSDDSAGLALAGRRLLLAKRFFAWITALYFSISLLAAGRILAELTIPAARAGTPVFYFATSVLLYSLAAYGLAIAGPGFLKLRFLVLALVSAAFLAAVVHSFGFFA